MKEQKDIHSFFRAATTSNTQVIICVGAYWPIFDVASSFSSSEIGAIIVLQQFEVQGQFVFKLQRDVGNDKYYTNENCCIEKISCYWLMIMANLLMKILLMSHFLLLWSSLTIFSSQVTVYILNNIVSGEVGEIDSNIPHIEWFSECTQT